MVATAILIESGLSFLGLGDPNIMSWGFLIGAVERCCARPGGSALSRVAILLTVLAINLVGEGLNDALNPTPKRETMSAPLLDIKNLHVALPRGSERSYAVEAVDLDLAPNEFLCVVGESGSGKSLTARAVMGLLPRPHVHIAEGSIHFGEEDLAHVSEARLRAIRGKRHLDDLPGADDRTQIRS